MGQQFLSSVISLSLKLSVYLNLSGQDAKLSFGTGFLVGPLQKIYS